MDQDRPKEEEPTPRWFQILLGIFCLAVAPFTIFFPPIMFILIGLGVSLLAREK